jgi:hypothetical protein
MFINYIHTYTAAHAYAHRESKKSVSGLNTFVHFCMTLSLDDQTELIELFKQAIAIGLMVCARVGVCVCVWVYVCVCVYMCVCLAFVRKVILGSVMVL